MNSTSRAKFFVHPNGIVEKGAQVGPRTRVWAFAHVLPGAKIGADCNICDGVFIEDDTVLGDRVTVKCGVQVWNGVVLEDDVFIGPNVTFTNDPLPRSRCYLEKPTKTIVKKGASIGGNATILPGITVGSSAMVGAGAVVTRDVPPYAIVMGNPARITGYMSCQKQPTSEPVPPDKLPSACRVAGVRLYELPHIVDMRGSLSVAEVGENLPFEPKRCFLIYDVPSAEVRGEHAHKTLHQFLICTRGSLAVVVEDGKNRHEFILSRPNLGLHIPPMVWATQYKYTQDAVLLVLASDVYKATDYIRDYDKFLECVSAASDSRK
jgi:UDP-2-acetamido-3-amino-2,3-dideoxy-glucuronate N-acetyltransferase